MAGEKIYISEYADAATALYAGQVIMCGQEPSLAKQIVDISGGVAASAAFNASTRFIRLHTNAIIAFAFGTAPTAALATDPRMAASATEFFGVVPGQKVSAIIST